MGLIKPLPHQIEAVRAVSAALQADAAAAPLVSSFTGTGKSVIIGDITHRAYRAGRRVLNLTHDETLVGQNEARLIDMHPDAESGIYHAGIGRRETDPPIIYAGIQSFFRAVNRFQPFDYVIIDEAHLVPPKGVGMYRSALDALRTLNPRLRLIGLTATPFRLGQGMLTEGDGRLFTEIVYDYGYARAVADGVIAPIVSRHGDSDSNADMDGVHTRLGEFIEAETHAEFMRHLPAQVEKILEVGKDRRCWLVFCVNIAHAEAMADALGRHVPTVLLTSQHGDREDVIDGLKDGSYRCAVNVDMLTTGTDIPVADMCVLARATQSVALYIQIIGRVSRRCEGKANGMILDFGGNILRHGPIEVAQQRAPGGGSPPVKSCQGCECLWPVMKKTCDTCGAEMEVPEIKPGKKLTREATDGGVTMSEGAINDPPPSPLTWDVERIEFDASVTKRGAPCVIVGFRVDGERRAVCRVWLMLWGSGDDNKYKSDYAKSKSLAMLAALTGIEMPEIFDDVAPEAVEGALTIARERGLIRKVYRITTLKNRAGFNELQSADADDGFKIDYSALAEIIAQQQEAFEEYQAKTNGWEDEPF